MFESLDNILPLGELLLDAGLLFLTGIQLYLVLLDGHGCGLVDVCDVALVRDNVIFEFVNLLPHGAFLIVDFFHFFGSFIIEFGQLVYPEIFFSDC